MLPQARTTTMSMLFCGLLVCLCVKLTHASYAAVFESTPPSSSYGNDHGGDFKYLFLSCPLFSFFFSLPLFVFCLASRRAVPYIRHLPGSRDKRPGRNRVYIHTYTQRAITDLSRLCRVLRASWQFAFSVIENDGAAVSAAVHRRCDQDGRFVAPATRRNCYGVSIRSCMPVFQHLLRLHDTTSVVERGRTAPNPVDTPPTPPPPPPPRETGEEKERRLLTPCQR